MTVRYKKRHTADILIIYATFRSIGESARMIRCISPIASLCDTVGWDDNAPTNFNYYGFIPYPQLLPRSGWLCQTQTGTPNRNPLDGHGR